jgi:autotransporter-associated beta strand protein
LIDYNGTPLADLSAFNLQNGSVGGHNATLINNTAGTSVDLLLDGTGPLQAMWMTDGNGDWNNAGNWSPSVPSGAGNIAYFGSITSAPRAITVSSPQTVAKMIFNNSAAGYTVSGSAVTLDSPNPAVGIDVLGGNHTVASPVVMNQDSTMYVQAASSLTISGNVSSAAGKGLTKTGPGLLTLSGANTYSGPTSVNRGTLRLNGTHTGGGAYSIASGAALGGTGSTDAQVNVSPGGIVAPGASVGVLTVASLSLSSSLLNFEADGSGVDRLNVTSTNGLTLAGVSTFSLTNLGGAVSGTFTKRKK